MYKMKPEFEDRRLKTTLQLQVENRQQAARPQNQKCPRCDSLNTKFCYYNNYSLSQPRYLCKACKRYWTQGGTLRNIPVGGGCRKGKRPKQTGDHIKFHQPPPQAPPHEVVFPGSSIMTTSPYFTRGEELGSCSTWVNCTSYESDDHHQAQDYCQAQLASSEIFQMIDQSRNCVNSSSQPAWPGSYMINNSNSTAPVGDTILWTAAADNNTASINRNPTNSSAAATTTTSYSSLNLSQWPDYMPGFCPSP